MIQTLTKASGSPEAREIQQTILAMAADQFEQRGLGKNLELELLRAAAPKSGFSVDVALQKADLSTWQNADGGVCALLSQNTVSQLDVISSPYDPKLLNGAALIHGPKKTIHHFIDLLIQFSNSHDLHPLLDLVAMMIVSGDIILRYALQVLHSSLGTHLTKGENMFVEATIHLHRRVELYAAALVTRVVEADQSFVPMPGLNVANVDLDIETAPEFDQDLQVQSEDIDQVLNDAAVVGGMDRVDSSGLDDIYGFSGGDLNLGSLDDLDLEMF